MIRGSDHRANAELQSELIRALGGEPPEFVHHGLLLGEDGTKLSKRHGASTLADLRDAGIPGEAVRAYLDELGVPRHDVHLDLARLRRLSVDALAALSDEELAARVGVPVSVAPVLRGARDLVEAREYAQQVLEPERVDVDAPETLARFRELVGERDGAACDRARAEGGRRRPEVAAARAHRPRARARAGGGDRRAAAGRAPAPDRRLGAVRLYNTLTRSVEELPPPPGPVRMYFCGPTVYARAHVGNASPFVSPMWLGSWLRGARLRRHARAQHHRRQRQDLRRAPGASAELAAQATEWYLEDTARSRSRHARRAAEGDREHLRRSSRSSSSLIASGHAYAVDGDVYFRVASDPEYGRLSGQRPDQVEEQEPNPLKEDPRDFALWKGTKLGEDTSLDSPWGRGRPGWHIECSAMAEDAFGPVFEIHGGGLDLVFPHHENELAQSRALGHEFARIWMHNGMLRVHRREDVEVARERRDDQATCSTSGDARRCCSSS